MSDDRCKLPEGSFSVAGKGPCGWEGRIEEVKGNIRWSVLNAGHVSGQCGLHVSSDMNSSYIRPTWSREDTQGLIDEKPESQDKLLQQVIRDVPDFEGFEMKLGSSDSNNM